MTIDLVLEVFEEILQTLSFEGRLRIFCLANMFLVDGLDVQLTVHSSFPLKSQHWFGFSQAIVFIYKLKSLDDKSFGLTFKSLTISHLLMYCSF